MLNSLVESFVGWFVDLLLTIVLGTCVMFFVALFIKLIWNACVPDVVGFPAITYWQSCGLFVLSNIFFKGRK